MKAMLLVALVLVVGCSELAAPSPQRPQLDAGCGPGERCSTGGYGTGNQHTPPPKAPPTVVCSPVQGWCVTR